VKLAIPQQACNWSRALLPVALLLSAPSHRCYTCESIGILTNHSSLPHAPRPQQPPLASLAPAPPAPPAQQFPAAPAQQSDGALLPIRRKRLPMLGQAALARLALAVAPAPCCAFTQTRAPVSRSTLSLCWF
jgi:hypothetical protein